MPFDPTLPVNNAKVRASELRDQFQGLKALIDAILTVTAAQVDSTTTLPPGNPANASVSVVGNTLHFTFDLPQGQMGSPGEPGQPGSDGNDGAPGPPFAQAVVDNVNTLDPDQPATVNVSFDGTNVHFAFGIPRGMDGSSGTEGSQGPPGEVSNADLATAISGTSANSNAVGTLGLGVNDPPTGAELQQVVNKLDELILALRR